MSPDVTVNLKAGPLELELSPSIGGSISRLDWVGAHGSRPILRACSPPLRSVLDACSFPLVPYVNRIRDGRFVFRGREVRLAPNMPGDPSPLHGQGWLGEWAVESAGGCKASLIFRHNRGEWPWAYVARQDFVLSSGGLTLTLHCQNVDSEPMPCGLGQHPYFPCGPKTRLDTIVTSAWAVDANVLPVDQVPAAGRYDLRERNVCGQDLDNGFGGWGGEARISDPDWPYRIVLTSPDARFFQLYSPTDGGLFVAEPVSHANAALNAPEEEWPDLGLRVLEPRQAMSLTMRLDVVPTG